MNYELQYPDVDTRLVDRIDPELTRNALVFYVARRHFLEILPELLTSGWMLFLIASICLNVNVFQVCGNQQCRTLVWTIIGLAVGVAFFVPFGAEFVRWNTDIYYLTQRDWSHYYFDFHKLDFVSENMGFVTSTKVVRPPFYKILGLDVGNLMARGVDESKRYTPLMPHPYDLQRRIREAQMWKPSSKPADIVWRE